MAIPPHPSRTPSIRRHRRFVALPAAVLTVGLAVTALAVPAVADPTPSPTTSTSAAPTIASVTAQLTALARQNEALTEKFNGATIDLAAKQKAANAAKAAADKAQVDYKSALRQYGSTIVEQYQNGQLNMAGALLTSTSTQGYLDTVSDLATVSANNNAVVDKLSATKQKAADAQAASAKAVTTATSVRDALATQKTTIETQTTKYKALLKSLTPVQQVAYTSRDNAPAGSAPSATPATSDAPAVHAGSAAAQTAIDFAMAQLGKPYQYATSGPDTYDCSGLTAAAWAAAGVQLPHQSSAQYGYGTHVSLSEMQPGDLVFFYSPISHVAIYLGNGMIVHAPTSGDVVKVSPLFGGAVGATRLT